MGPTQDTDDFSGQVAWITGGSRGIGLATARAFLEHGARVAIGSPDPARLAAAERQLDRLGPLEAGVLDVRHRDRIQRFMDRVLERFGTIDVLVNNAGLAYSGDFIDQDNASIDALIDVNVKGVLYMTQAVLPVMRRQQRGVIINVSSGAGLSGFAGLATYCASKFAVVGFTESLAREVDGQGIRVYAVCPGRVATDMQQTVSGRKIGMPAERVAESILRLAARRSLLATGKCLPIPS